MGASPRDVQLLSMDLRGDSYGDLADVPHAADPPITDPREALHGLSDVMTAVNTRLDTMGRAGVRNIAGVADDRPPRIVILIDELLPILRTDESATQRSLIFLAGRARSAGVHTILAASGPLSDLDFVASNVTEQIAFDTNLISRARVPSSMLPSGRLEPGEFLWEPMEATYPLRRRVVSVTQQETTALSEHWRKQTSE
jgi:DNA segregation ATPase FtsK/SpoIIIE, S-DNA-T family